MSLTRHLARRARRGFSLIELAVVLIVIGVIAAIAIPTFQRVIDNSDTAATEESLSNVMRNATVIARLGGRDLPTAADITAALAESPGFGAMGAGVSASVTTAVCEEDNNGDIDPVCESAGDVVLRYRTGGGVGALAVYRDSRCFYGSVTGGTVSVWSDGGATVETCRAEGALDGPPSGTDPAPVTYEDTQVAVFQHNSPPGVGAGTGAIDNVRVTSGRGTTGSHLYLSDGFATDGPVVTGTPIGQVTSNALVNSSPIAGLYGGAPGQWINPLLEPNQGTPVVSGGVLRHSDPGTELNQIAWDFTADEYELSFQIAEMPSDYDELRLIATDLSTMTHAALLKVNRGTVSLEVTAPGTARGVIRAFRNVSVGDRVGIRYLSDGVYRLTHNGSVVSSASISRSEVLSVIGSVTAANPETCTVQAYTGTAGPLWGWVATAGVAADGSFALGALAGQQIRVQVHCPDWPSPNWYGGVTPDDHLDATVNTITDPVTDLGTIGAP